MTLATLPVDQIETGQRLRQISEVQVETLVASIADIGLLNPITVYARQVIRGGEPVDGFGLVAGAHRLEAFRRLGLVEIAAQIVGLSDLERQIAECDENLCGPKLTPSERARFTKRRKDAYEALHPETKHGDAGAAARWNADEKFAPAFSTDTAKATGQSERTVQLHAERGGKVIDEVVDLIRGTKLDTGTYLDKLKGLRPNEQVTAAKRDLAHARQQERDKAPATNAKNGKRVERAEEKRLEQFRHSFGIIMQGCRYHIPELVLPPLSAEEAQEAVKEIHAARRNLSVLLKRIAGESVTTDDVEVMKAEWADERKDLKRQIDEQKLRAKEAKSSQHVFANQLQELRSELAGLRDQRDTLQHELERARRQD